MKTFDATTEHQLTEAPEYIHRSGSTPAREGEDAGTPKWSGEGAVRRLPRLGKRVHSRSLGWGEVTGYLLTLGGWLHVEVRLDKVPGWMKKNLARLSKQEGREVLPNLSGAELSEKPPKDPRAPKLKGVVKAVVEVSGDEVAHGAYNHPVVSLYRENGYGDAEVLCSITYQRNDLRNTSHEYGAARRSDRPASEWDFGSIPWGPCYAGTVDGDFRLEYRGVQTMEAVVAVMKQLTAYELPRADCHPTCALTSMVRTLRNLKVPVEVRRFERTGYNGGGPTRRLTPGQEATYTGRGEQYWREHCPAAAEVLAEEAAAEAPLIAEHEAACRAEPEHRGQNPDGTWGPY